jgi:hypothetical protein
MTRGPEAAQVVWRLAVALVAPDRPDTHNLARDSLRVLRAAEHDVSVIDHARSLGWTLLTSTEATDASMVDAVHLLDAIVDFLGVRRAEGDVAAPR